MSDAVWGQGVLTGAYESGQRWGSPVGRHAVDEDAALTPIFHALVRSGWGSRAEHVASRDAGVAVADPVEAFRRDPLEAPLPVVDGEGTGGRPGRRRAGTHAAPDARGGGRHHRRLVPLEGGAGEE